MDPPQNSTSSLFPRAKITAFARLKTLTDSVTSRRSKPDPIFPPPSWEIDKLTIDSKSGWDETESESPSTTSSGDEAATNSDEAVEPTPQASQPEGPEPLTFAQRIRDLIESLPLPGTSTTSHQDATDTPNEVSKAKDGSIGPPAAPGVDEELVQMLASEEVMNGDEKDAGKETNRPSVWSLLSTMQWKGKEKEKDEGGFQDPPTSTPRTQGGIMMCAPLEPANDSNVELAQTCSSPGEVTDRPNFPVLEKPGGDVEWVPSTTQISVYVTWWGYRLYLPPSIMTALDSVSFKATTQAAMVTGALKWLLDKVPDMLVPPQFRPTLVMMKRLGPIVGYIGVFVAWSWGRIEKHDKGSGVVLTATWLLPVALVPMAWDAGDISKPVLLPKPEDRVSQAKREGFGDDLNENSTEEQETEKKSWFWPL